MSSVPITQAPLSRKSQLAEILGQSLGQGLGSLTNSYYANKAIEKVMSDPELEGADPSKRMGSLQQALMPFGQYGDGILQQRLGLEKQRVEEQRVLKDQKRAEQFKQTLLNRGIDPQVAELYAGATEGGRTSLINALVDAEQRGLLPGGGLLGSSEAYEPSVAKTEEFPELPKETGLKPSDIVSRENAREKVNEPFISELSNKIRSNEDSLGRVNLLNNINETGKLPSGLGRWNVDGEGKLNFPPGAGKDAELYVKTVNEEMDAAKNTYGSRLTNFDAQQFIQRLPSLSNSADGRRLILARLKNVREANLLYDRELRKTFLHYGSNKITESKARQITEDRIRPQLDAIRKQGETVDSLIKSVGERAVPKEGDIIVNKKTGQRMRKVEGKWKAVQ